MTRFNDMPMRSLGAYMMTPQDAESLLEASTDMHNRKLIQHRHEEYADLMATGRWQAAADGSVLYVNKAHHLLNGQHRLNALIKADVTLPFLIIEVDTDKQSMQAIFDQNANRTVAQITETSRNFCAVCEFLYRWVLGYNRRANPEVVNSFIIKMKAHKVFDAVLDMAQKGMAKKAGNAPIWCRAAFITAKLLKYEDVDAVFESFINEDTTDNFANTLWKFIRKTGKPSSISAKMDAYYQFLYRLKKPTAERLRKPEQLKTSVESRLKEILA